MRQYSRTCLVEVKREFSAFPAPRISYPPGPEKQNPATVAAVNGAKVLGVIDEDRQEGYLSREPGAMGIRDCRANPNLVVEVLDRRGRLI